MKSSTSIFLSLLGGMALGCAASKIIRSHKTKEAEACLAKVLHEEFVKVHDKLIEKHEQWMKEHPELRQKWKNDYKDDSSGDEIK